MAPIFQQIIAAFDKGDLAEAQAKQASANVIIQIFIRYGGLTAGKAMMKMIGLDCGPTRLPLRSLDEQQQSSLRAELEAASFFNLCSHPTKLLLLPILLGILTMATRTIAGPLVYQGTDGPAKGKHIVFIASDHEYKSEEILPELARILAKHYGAECTVLFGIDPQTGFISGRRSAGQLQTSPAPTR